MNRQPDPAMDLTTITMINEALRQGLTWAQIGSVIIGRPDARAAKAHAKKIARRANRHAAALIGTEGGPGA